MFVKNPLKNNKNTIKRHSHAHTHTKVFANLCRSLYRRQTIIFCVTLSPGDKIIIPRNLFRYVQKGDVPLLTRHLRCHSRINKKLDSFSLKMQFLTNVNTPECSNLELNKLSFMKYFFDNIIEFVSY